LGGILHEYQQRVTCADEIFGKRNVDTDQAGAENEWILAAAGNTDVSGWPDGEHPCEALGPRVQGNPLALAEHVCIPFNFEAPTVLDVPRSYHELREFLATLDSEYSPGHLAHPQSPSSTSLDG
jgi:hypothetical protein